MDRLDALEQRVEAVEIQADRTETLFLDIMSVLLPAVLGQEVFDKYLGQYLNRD